MLKTCVFFGHQEFAIPSPDIDGVGPSLHLYRKNPAEFPPEAKEARYQDLLNTDQEAARAGGLRGGFYGSDRPGARWESTAYHGARWVEAFVIRNAITSVSARATDSS